VVLSSVDTPDRVRRKGVPWGKCLGHMGSLHHSQRGEGWDTVQRAPLGHCHLQVRKASMTPPEPLAITPSFAEALSRHVLLASVHMLQKWHVAIPKLS